MSGAILKRALVGDSVVRGLHEVAQDIDAAKDQGMFLAESCNEPAHKKLVQRICVEKNIPLVDVPDNKLFKEWARLCKIDKDCLSGEVVGSSCACVTDFGEHGQAYVYWLKFLSSK